MSVLFFLFSPNPFHTHLKKTTYKTTRNPLTQITHHQAGATEREAASPEGGGHATKKLKETMAVRAVATLAASAMVLAVLLLAGGASAQSSPSPSSQCTTVLVSLSPCLNYISGNESTAPATCCAQLGKVVQSDPQCLCVALSADPASLGLTVNRTRALGLPDACKVKTPDVSNCKGGAAAGAPVTSPGTTTTPATGATGSKTTPTASTSSVPGAAAASPRGKAGLVAGFVVAAVVVAGSAV